VHQVLSDPSLQKDPHKIENGEGEVLSFLGVVRDRNGDRMELELLAPPDVGAPMHLHHLQEEAMTVVAGKLGLQFDGEQPRYAGPGETVILKQGVGHRWWNAGTTELRCTGWPNRRTTSSTSSRLSSIR
jgi:uncharacterized cupin superfamily protein